MPLDGAARARCMARLHIKLQEMIERGQFNFDFMRLLDEIHRVRVGLDPIHTFDIDVVCDAGKAVKTRPLTAPPAKHDPAMHDRTLPFLLAITPQRRQCP